MLRKIFGGTMMLSITGAIVLGGVFAWGASGSGNGANYVGVANTTAFLEQNGALIGPNDGVYRNVGHIELYNNASSQYGLQLTKGAVKITSVNEDLAPDDGKCHMEDFAGQVVNIQTGIVLPGAKDPGTGQVEIQVMPVASSSCMGKHVSYTATLNADLVSLN